jgi:hypothetical protein
MATFIAQKFTNHKLSLSRQYTVSQLFIVFIEFSAAFYLVVQQYFNHKLLFVKMVF